MSFFKRGNAGDLSDLRALVQQKRIVNMLAAGSVNEGALNLKSGVKIEGEQTGAVHISGKNGVLWIGAEGIVKGDVKAPSVYVSGTLDGTVVADTLMIDGSARVSGRVYVDHIVYANLDKVVICAEFSPKNASVEADTNVPAQLVPIQLVAAG